MPDASHHLFIPTQDNPASGRIIMRDGETAQIRPARREDLSLLQAFFAGLSDPIRYRRFFSASIPTDSYITELCDIRSPRSG